ncbi:MAG: hypothetical protein WBX25_13905 [Rhodomicrobium sp.]
MKVKLRITRAGGSVYEGIYDVTDAESFGKACADVWCKLKQQQIETETSIGALIEHLEHDTIGGLSGAQITVEQA